MLTRAKKLAINKAFKEHFYPDLKVDLDLFNYKIYRVKLWLGLSVSVPDQLYIPYPSEASTKIHDARRRRLFR